MATERRHGWLSPLRRFQRPCAWRGVTADCTAAAMSRDRPQTPGEALARTVAALMRRGKAFEDTVMKDPTGDTRRRGDVHGRGDSGLDRPGDRRGGGGGSLNFTGKNVDRFFLVGCSPYTFLQGTKSELLPPPAPPSPPPRAGPRHSYDGH